MGRIDRRQALFGAGAAAIGAVAACGLSAPNAPIADASNRPWPVVQGARCEAGAR